MPTKPQINIIFTISLLVPLASSASCLDSIDPEKNTTTGDCEINSGNLHASDQQRLVQNQFSTTEGYPANKSGSKSDAEQAPIKNDTNLDSYDWIPAAWYEVY